MLQATWGKKLNPKNNEQKEVGYSSNVRAVA
jgi:hypothetical protein